MKRVTLSERISSLICIAQHNNLSSNKKCDNITTIFD